MSKNPCCTNNSCVKPPRGRPLTIPQIANAGKSNNRLAQIQKLESVEDYVFGVHNPSYSASAAKPKKHPHIYRRKDAGLLDFANLDCVVIENILCIHHNNLNNTTPKKQRISNC